MQWWKEIVVTSSTRLGYLLALAAVLPHETLNAASAGDSQYAVVTTVAMGSPERWDYLTYDTDSHRIYVAHGDRVTVVDGRTGKVIGEVLGIPGGTHGIAISGATGKGFTDDGEAGTVVEFDLKTLKLLRSIAGRPDADGIALDSRSGHLFVSNGESKDVSVIDPKTDQNLGNIAGGGKLEFIVADGQGKVFVNGEEKEEIVRIDASANKVDARWPVTGCRSPHGLAISKKSHRLFVSCINNTLVVVSSDDGHEVAHLPIGSGSDAVAFDPLRKRIFSSNGRDGTITVLHEVDPDHYQPLGDIKTGATARTMTIDPISGRLYVAIGEIDASVPTSGRPRVKSGSLRLLFLDPNPVIQK